MDAVDFLTNFAHAGDRVRIAIFYEMTGEQA
jgi:hypothetical protein